MARRLFYLNEVNRQKGWIRGETVEHLRRVLRVAQGQVYDLSDGERFYVGEVAGLGRNEVEFDLLESREPPRPPLDVHLLASLFKFDHFEWMLEKAVELGVARITPVQSIRSEKGLEQAAAKRSARWARILREAGQQCRRLKPPELDEPVDLKAALAMQGERRLWLDESPGGAPVIDAAPESGSVLLLAGPEGGWDDRERAQAAAQGWTAVTLGPLILRAETACLAALAVLNAKACAAKTIE
jgi:16S rRNA (uracil1498-N3)-methyltransferase